MHTHPRHEDQTATAHTDPVCGMSVDPQSAAGSETRAGTTYYFCSRHCLDKFRAEPDRYTGPKAAPADHSCCATTAAARPVPSSSARPADSAVGGVKYTCPMHPEVVRDGPGTCPKCGMALEPMTPQVEEDDSELRDMTRRFWVATVLTVPLLVLAMGPMVGLSVPGWLAHGGKNWLELALATPVVLWAGWPFFVRAGQALLQPNREHVHAHRARDRGRVGLQRGRDGRPRPVPRRVPRRARACRCTSRRPRSS